MGRLMPVSMSEYPSPVSALGGQQPQMPVSPYDVAKARLKSALIINETPPPPPDPRDNVQSAYTSLKYGGIRDQILEHLNHRAPALLEGIKAGLHHAGQDPVGLLEKGFIAQSVPTKLHQALAESDYGRSFLARHPGRTFGRYI